MKAVLYVKDKKGEGADSLELLYRPPQNGLHHPLWAAGSCSYEYLEHEWTWSREIGRETCWDPADVGERGAWYVGIKGDSSNLDFWEMLQKMVAPGDTFGVKVNMLGRDVRTWAHFSLRDVLYLPFYFAYSFKYMLSPVGNGVSEPGMPFENRVDEFVNEAEVEFLRHTTGFDTLGQLALQTEDSFNLIPRDVLKYPSWLVDTWREVLEAHELRFGMKWEEIVEVYRVLERRSKLSLSTIYILTRKFFTLPLDYNNVEASENFEKIIEALKVIESELISFGASPKIAKSNLIRIRRVFGLLPTEERCYTALARLENLLATLPLDPNGALLFVLLLKKIYAAAIQGITSVEEELRIDDMARALGFEE